MLERNIPIPPYAEMVLNLARAVSSGALAAQNRDFQNHAFQLHRSNRSYPNPAPESIESGLNTLSARLRVDQNVASDVMPSRVKFLLAWVALLDQHKLPIDRDIFPAQPAQYFVEEVISTADSQKRQLTVLEQFEIALQHGDNQPIRSLLLAHSGSRAIARGSDNRAGYSYKLSDLKKWGDCVGYFPNSINGYGDPAGDTYHFWGQIIAGILASRSRTPKDYIWKTVYHALFPNTSYFVKALRKPEHMTSNEIFLHKEVDQSAFSIGKKLSHLAG